MRKLVLWAALIPLALLMACIGVDEEKAQDVAVSDPAYSSSGRAVRIQSNDSGADMAAFPTPGAEFYDTAEGSAGPDTTGVTSGSSTSDTSLLGERREVISNASVSVEVDSVQSAVGRIRSITEGYGGFVERLSSSGGPAAMLADMTVRVPQAHFLDAVEQIQELGVVQEINLGRDDVTGQFIDLGARLKSAKREEESLLALMDPAPDIEYILTIERELSRVRSEIERLQGRVNHLQQLTDLATIQVHLSPPYELVRRPPSAHLSIELDRVSGRVDQLRNVVASLNGELERVLISTYEDGESAEVSLLVAPQDFPKVMAFLESDGKVVYKEVEENTGPPERLGDANSRIDVDFRQPESLGMVTVIAGISLGVILVIGLAVAFLLTYQRGRSRRDRRDRFAQL